MLSNLAKGKCYCLGMGVIYQVAGYFLKHFLCIYRMGWICASAGFYHAVAGIYISGLIYFNIHFMLGSDGSMFGSR